MIEKICGFIKKYDMLHSGDTILCGLSGGADSTALLLSLFDISEKFGFSVEAVHVNHCLRGTESDRDQQFCSDLCQRLGIPFTAFSCDVKGFAEKNSLSCEEAARKLRYDIFKSCSDGKKIATAHNADDNLETMLLNLIRGTGIKGIAGIPPVRDNIIRPLLTVSRQEIEEFLAFKGQDFVTDSTNLSDDYTRNKLRHNIIPLMRELNPSLTSTSARTAEVLRSENRFIEAETDIAMEKCLKNGIFYGLDKYGCLIRKRCISRLLSENDISLSAKRLDDCDNILVNGGKLNLSGDLYFISDKISASIKTIAPDPLPFESEKELIIGENRIFPHSSLFCELMKCENLEKIDFVHKNLTSYLLDYDKIIGRTVVRSRKFGDRIQLKGRNFSSSVKKLINEKVPAGIRSELHFIEDEMGTIFGEFIGVAQRVAPDENSSRLLKITVERKDWSV